MPRRLRFAPPGYWLHLTQRGNNKQPVFSTDADRHRFLDLVEQHSEERDVRIIRVQHAVKQMVSPVGQLYRKLFHVPFLGVAGGQRLARL